MMSSATASVQGIQSGVSKAGREEAGAEEAREETALMPPLAAILVELLHAGVLVLLIVRIRAILRMTRALERIADSLSADWLSKDRRNGT